MLECDYHNRYDSYQYNYYQEKDEQPLPSQCLQTQAQPYRMPSPTLTLLLSPPPPEQTSSCTYKPASIGYVLIYYSNTRYLITNYNKNNHNVNSILIPFSLKLCSAKLKVAVYNNKLRPWFLLSIILYIV